ncbi:uncharacterized protein BT62DRAFT_1014458, partial [Guyanagaster necrorhizus]
MSYPYLPIISVLNYHPSEGNAGVPIFVQLYFYYPTREQIYLRLNIGWTAVTTQVSKISEKYHRYHLRATIPHRMRYLKVALSIEVVDSQNNVLHSVFVGYFTYKEPDIP